MNLKSYKITVKKNKNNSKLNSAQFSLAYKQDKTKVEIKKQIYEIISAFKGSNNVLVEMNSSMFSIQSGKDLHVKRFINSIRKLDLDYRYNKIPANSDPSFFSRLMGKKDSEYAHEILTFVPHDIWVTKDFQDIVPLCGIRYYITKNDTTDIEGEKLLNKMSKMMDCEKLDYFKVIIFDGGQLANMGINSHHLAINDIKELLGLV